MDLDDLEIEPSLAVPGPGIARAGLLDGLRPVMGGLLGGMMGASAASRPQQAQQHAHQQHRAPFAALDNSVMPLLGDGMDIDGSGESLRRAARPHAARVQSWEIQTLGAAALHARRRQRLPPSPPTGPSKQFASQTQPSGLMRPPPPRQPHSAQQQQQQQQQQQSSQQHGFGMRGPMHPSGMQHAGPGSSMPPPSWTPDSQNQQQGYPASQPGAEEDEGGRRATSQPPGATPPTGGSAGPPPSSIAAQLRPGPFPRVPRVLPGPAGKLQALQAAGRLETTTPEALGLSNGGGDEVRGRF
jgi:hypothetical protein